MRSIKASSPRLSDMAGLQFSPLRTSQHLCGLPRAGRPLLVATHLETRTCFAGGAPRMEPSVQIAQGRLGYVDGAFGGRRGERRWPGSRVDRPDNSPKLGLGHSGGARTWGQAILAWASSWTLGNKGLRGAHHAVGLTVGGQVHVAGIVSGPACEVALKGLGACAGDAVRAWFGLCCTVGGGGEVEMDMEKTLCCVQGLDEHCVSSSSSSQHSADEFGVWAHCKKNDLRGKALPVRV